MRVRIVGKSAAIAVALGVALTASAAGFVTYEECGAKGDGKADDLPAIVRAHEIANAKGLPVRANDKATYYIGGRDLTAKVMTDTDFGTAKFVIDDRQVERSGAAVFALAPSAASYAVTGVKTLRRDMTSFGVKLPARSLLLLEDANRRQYRRTGDANMTNSGQPQCELLIVGADGTLDSKTEVVQDMAVVTKARAFPIDVRRLTVSGGFFKTIANRESVAKTVPYKGFRRGISITRSNVLLKDVEHTVVDQIDGICPYSGFVNINKAAEVTVSNCVFFARRKTSHGTYDITLSEAVDVRFVNCREATDIRDNGNFWSFGSNYCRDLTFDGCTFGRFDAHAGVHNATIRNSRLVQVNAVGTGRFLVENTRVEGYVFSWFRSDYGSNWDGDFIVRNCVWTPNAGKESAFIAMGNDGSHDYGYPCRMARRILVDGLTVDNALPQPFTWFRTFSRESAPDAPYPYLAPTEIVLRNVKIVRPVEPVLSNTTNFLAGTRIER